MRHFYFQLPDGFSAGGPIKAESLADAKRKLRKELGVERLPVGAAVWEEPTEVSMFRGEEMYDYGVGGLRSKRKKRKSSKGRRRKS